MDPYTDNTNTLGSILRYPCSGPLGGARFHPPTVWVPHRARFELHFCIRGFVFIGFYMGILIGILEKKMETIGDYKDYMGII